MRRKKLIIKLFLIVIFILLFIVISLLIIQKYKDNKINDDISSIYSNPKYNEACIIEGIDVKKQEISCGYAVMEMISNWNNNTVTEKGLFDKYGKVVTSSSKNFEKEMNKQFTMFDTKMYKYLKNSELIDKVYESLSKGIPVPFEWAAKYNDEWTLHYSIVYGIDVKNDLIVIANPYGYVEEISIKEFLDRTSFKVYKNMPIYFKLAFSIGLFEKNTIFIINTK